MDAAAFRLVLIAIAVLVVLAIYFLGQHQARLRRRSAMESFTRDEVDSTFIEDEQLHSELDNLNRIMRDDRDDGDLEQFRIEAGEGPRPVAPARHAAEVFVPARLTGRDPGRVVSYHLRHEDFRLITGEEASAAAEQVGLQLNGVGYLEYREDGEIAFQVASLSAPGTFTGIDQLEFATLGFNCFVDFEVSADPRQAYEAMLKKIDELVRLLNVKVYKPDQRLLTISDVTDLREQFG